MKKKSPKFNQCHYIPPSQSTWAIFH